MIRMHPRFRKPRLENGEKVLGSSRSGSGLCSESSGSGMSIDNGVPHCAGEGDKENCSPS